MSDWYWRVIVLKSAFVLACFVSYLRCDDPVQKLTFCNPHSDAGPDNDLLIVSTLDGRLTAFSTHDGTEAWHLETQPLLSSNLQHVELSSGGKWVRLVPSLRGSLYSVSGDNIEPLPFNAEQLLSSSFKYSDDLVIAGSHESAWIGVDAGSGSVVYECSSSGCSGERSAALAGRELLVLRTQASTVRAIDPTTGTQKWNFSVAEHQLAVGGRRECHDAKRAAPRALALALALPEGRVACRLHGANLWHQQLEAPVAGMWRLHGETLQTIDVVAQGQGGGGGGLAEGSVHPAPSLYIGIHRKQLYIQESGLYAKKIETAVSSRPIPWKLQQSRPLLTDEHSDKALQVQDADPNTLNLIAMQGNTALADDRGYFLYLQETCDEAVQVPEIDDDDMMMPNDSYDHQHIHVHVYSLWFWWKEVFLIAISSALLMNLMIWPRFFAPKFRGTPPLPVNQEVIVVEKHFHTPTPSGSSSGSGSVEYCGRYETDFTALRCLGKGGFGVVFEARNNIDHCSYAVKRITLPKRESKRERVLREVRALAKLEHEHIVRYFNAWLEEPPPHWQERRDAQLLRDLPGVSDNVTSDYTAASPPREKREGERFAKEDSVRLTIHKCEEAVDALQYYGKEVSLPSKRYRSRSCNDSFVIEFEEDSKKASSRMRTRTRSKNSAGPELTPPNCLTRSPASGDNDDSFIVFANSENPDLSQGPDVTNPLDYTKGQKKGHSEARKDSSFDKRLKRVKECEGYVKADNSSKKKKGHTRHWSLDMCVRNSDGVDPSASPVPPTPPPPPVGKMYLYIQMQLCRPDSLHDWLRNNRSVHDRRDQIKTLFSQIVSAVEYVHLAGLIHRDLKPSNIFFALDGKVKVGDFGLVTAMSDTSQDGDASDGKELVRHGHTHRVGTHLYMSPEQRGGGGYSYKVDIYSLGVILFELLHPFGTEAERIATLQRLRDDTYPEYFHHHHPNETEVLKLMLSRDPERRPTATGVRARAPLYQCTDEQWHFALPPPVYAA